jgi:hypothetical protein
VWRWTSDSGVPAVCVCVCVCLCMVVCVCGGVYILQHFFSFLAPSVQACPACLACPAVACLAPCSSLIAYPQTFPIGEKATRNSTIITIIIIVNIIIISTSLTFSLSSSPPPSSLCPRRPSPPLVYTDAQLRLQGALQRSV